METWIIWKPSDQVFWDIIDVDNCLFIRWNRILIDFYNCQEDYEKT